MLSSHVMRVIPHSGCKTEKRGEWREWQIMVGLLQALCSVQSAQCGALNSHRHRLDTTKGHLHGASTGSTTTTTHTHRRITCNKRNAQYLHLFGKKAIEFA